MAQPPPFPIDAVAWDDIPSEQRFVCFEDDDASLPEPHRRQICRLTSSSAARLSEWLDTAMPAGWSADDLEFPNSEMYRLTDDHWNTEQGKQAVREWLHNRGIPYGRIVYLVYEWNRVVSLPWKLLVKYWDAFAYPVGYAMIAADLTTQWACSFHHEDVIIFGSHKPIVTEQRDGPTSR